MSTSCEKSKSGNMRKPSLSPQPGEIWELNRHVGFSEEFSLNQDNKLYSIEAKSFLEDDTPPRYVMIVTEPEVDIIISVMVLSAETDFISDIDLVIPNHITGLGQDLLAETWHVQPMLVCNLLHSVGKRLSRDIYDLLLNVGDYSHGLVNQQPEINYIEGLGLKVGDNKALDNAEIVIFHHREKAWSDILAIPVAAHNTYIKSVNLTDVILRDRLQLEQELIDFESYQNGFINSLSKSFNQTQIILSRWWQNIFEPEWLAFPTLPNLAIATRSHSEPENIQQNILELIQQLSAENDENQRQNVAKQLGEIAVGSSDAVQALVNLLRSTSDDETLWIAVESLRKIDPENPAAGIRRVKAIDLGMEIAGKAVALSVALLQKFQGDVSVLLQVYPTGNDDYLPADLKLLLIDDSGNILREITARRADVYLQLKFSCEVGERFSVQVALGDTNFCEDFVV